MMPQKLVLAASYVVLLLPAWTCRPPAAAAAAVSAFDDNPLPANTHWGGAGSGQTGFSSGLAYYPHFDRGWAWDGFVYSSETNSTVGGVGSQFSARAGGGALGTANYGVSYVALDWASGTYAAIPNTLTLLGAAYDSVLAGAYFTNTTYAYYSMRDGDAFAKKFGGLSGNDPDWFKLSIGGLDPGGAATGAVEFYLADFRCGNHTIVKEWTWVDLTPLGRVAALQFTLSSSDTGGFGMNTPSCFAMDELVPEPAALSTLALGGLAVGIRRQRGALAKSKGLKGPFDAR